MKYLLLFYFAGFILADDTYIKNYKLHLQPQDDGFKGTITLTLSDNNNNNDFRLDPYNYTVDNCTYKGTDSLDGEKNSDCEFDEETNTIKFYGNRTTEEVVLEFSGKFQENGLSRYTTDSEDKFYVADMTAENHQIIFPCRADRKAQFEFEGTGDVVMSNLENLKKKDEKKEVYLRNLTFVKGDIVKDENSNGSLQYYRMKSSEKMGEKLKNVMKNVADLNPDLTVLFTPVNNIIPIMSRDVIILSNVHLKSNDSGSDYSTIIRKLTDKLFQRPKGEKKIFFDIVGPKFTANKIFDVPDSFFEEHLKPFQIYALAADGLNDSKSLNELASEYKRTKEGVLYVKGTSVLNSLESICGNKNFRTGISKYVRNTSTVNEAFEGCFADKDKAGEFFKVWTDDPGYPAVHVILNKSQQYHMVQERFLWFGSKQKDQRWVIPIDYKTKEGSVKNIILPATKNGVTETINSTYFILDHNNKGFYRVNYDAKVWKALISQLKSNHTEIDPPSRMKLIDDVFSFPKSTYNFTHDIPDYVTALKLSEYLVTETDFLTLRVAFEALGFLDSALSSSYHGKYRDHMKGILKEIYNKNLTAEDEKLHLLACKFGVEECIKNAEATFDKIGFNTTKLSVQDAVAICSVVRNNHTKWVKASILLDAKKINSIVKDSLLACTRDEKILQLFLSQIISSEDRTRFKEAVTSAMEHNPDNIRVILGIIKQFEDAIIKIMGNDTLQDIVLLTLPKVNSESAATLKEIAKNLDEQSKENVDRVCQNIQLWTDTKAKSVTKYFKGSGSGSQAKPIALVLLVTTLLPFANHIFHS